MIYRAVIVCKGCTLEMVVFIKTQGEPHSISALVGREIIHKDFTVLGGAGRTQHNIADFRFCLHTLPEGTVFPPERHTFCGRNTTFFFYYFWHSDCLSSSAHVRVSCSLYVGPIALITPSSTCPPTGGSPCSTTYNLVWNIKIWKSSVTDKKKKAWWWMIISPRKWCSN